MDIKENDKVRFIDEIKNNKYGVLVVQKIKGENATIMYGSYKNLGNSIMTIKLTELKKN